MKLQDDGLVIEAGPGSRQQALDYGIARFREREKTKRLLIVIVSALITAAGFEMVFGPEGRQLPTSIVAPAFLLLALGAIGATKFALKLPAVEIKVDD